MECMDWCYVNHLQWSKRYLFQLYVPTAFVTKTSIVGNICDDKLSQIICPTLIIHGMKDYMVEEGHAHNLNEKIAKSQ